MRPALTPLILSIYKVAVHASAAGKQIVLDEVDFSTREKVPGENSAYFTGPPNLDQFFTILDLRVSPNPPQIGKPIFLYLNGIAPSFANLSNATLRTRITLDGLTIFDMEEKMECFPGVMVKRRGEYRGPLKGEKNELVAEFAIPETLAPEKKYIVAVEAKVHTSNEVGCAPLQVSQVRNRDVLFSFEAAIVLGK